MTSRIALLRGINVGRANRVAMADLRALFEGLGFTGVRTLLNSGNVVFESDGAGGGGEARRIEEALREKLGVSSRVTVLDASELAEIVRENPMEKIAVDPSRLLVGVLGATADKGKLSSAAGGDWGNERIVLGRGRAVYMWMPDGVIASRVNAAVARAMGDGITARNWATLLKLLALAGADGGRR